MDHEARLEQIRGDLSREYNDRSGTVQFLIALAAGIVVVLWVSLDSHAFPPWVALVGVVPGTILLRRMGRSHKRLSKLGLLSVFYDRALTRQNLTWMNDPPVGAEIRRSGPLIRLRPRSFWPGFSVPTHVCCTYRCRPRRAGALYERNRDRERRPRRGPRQLRSSAVDWICGKRS